MYTIERSIEIDAGHRVPTHESKCRHPHGHRYRISLTCQRLMRDLVQEGKESGMVMDFGVIKEVMMEKIHDVYDHTFIIFQEDPLLDTFLQTPYDLAHVRTGLSIVPIIPTAENLAEHWYWEAAPAIGDRSNHQVSVIEIAVRETPNSIAVYRPVASHD